MSYKIEFTLKQHTPIIHFQHDQEGATLRATEVKPKLDRFIINKMGGWEAVPSEWKVGKRNAQHEALDYKVCVRSSEVDHDISGEIAKEYYDRRGNIRREKFPTFFGLMGGDNEGTKQFRLYKNVELVLTSQKTSLIKSLENAVPTFFMKYNFGTRQSKGFGSFYPIDIKIPGLKYRFDVDVTKPRKIVNKYVQGAPPIRFMQYFRLFEILNLFYATLRSGINQSWGANPMYFKSMMFMYAKNKMGVEWDKKKIKTELFSNKLIAQQRKYPGADILHFSSRESYLMRDLIGLATDSQWYAEYRDAIKTESKEGIERFKSPIHFKPIETEPGKFRIYFEGNQDDLNKMLNRRFKISKRNGQSFEIKTPPKFKIDEFLRYAISIDVSKHIQVRGAGFSADKKLLEDIYIQLKNNATF